MFQGFKGFAVRGLGCLFFWVDWGGGGGGGEVFRKRKRAQLS